jgi:hypothetical protein
VSTDLKIKAMENLLATYGRRLAKLERYAASGRFLAYTPALTATVTNPTLGAGTATGTYSRFGNWVYARGRIVFGAGMTAGSGNYTISLPYAARIQTFESSTLNFGSVRLAVGGVGAATVYCPTLLFTNGVASFTMRYPAYAGGATGNDTQVTNAAPWIWASGNSLQWQVLYEAAE